jgi:hypothetical protein
VSWDEVLGIAPTASEVEITAAYRRLAKQVHPDTAPAADDATRRARALEMARLNEAYREARIAATAQHVVVLRPGPIPLAPGAITEAEVAARLAPETSAVDSPEPRLRAEEPLSSAPIALGTPWRPRWGWRLVGAGVVAALAFGVVTAQSSSAPKDPTVDSCVAWSGGYHQASCNEPHTGRVVMAVDDATLCPSRSSYMRAGKRVLCIDVSK